MSKPASSRLTRAGRGIEAARNGAHRENGQSAALDNMQRALAPKPRPLNLPAKLDIDTDALSIGDVKLLLTGTASPGALIEILERAVIGGVDQYKYLELKEIARQLAEAIKEDQGTREKK